MVLKKGSRGENVKALQEDLIALGYGKLLGDTQADGDFGKRTRKAVKAFQLAHDMPDNGVADEATLQRMQLFLKKIPDERPAPAAPSTPSPLGARIAAVVATELGKKEERHDNMGEAIARYKALTKQATGRDTTGGAWCADFASFALNEAAPGLIRPTSVAKGLRDQFKAHGAFQSASANYTPKAGDLIFFNRGTPRDPWMGHVGFVTKIDQDGTVHTIEGNKEDPRFKGLTEGVDYRWNAAAPDAVRHVSYSPAELKEARLLGYGAVDKMEQYALNHHTLPSPTVVAGLSGRGAKPQKS